MAKMAAVTEVSARGEGTPEVASLAPEICSKPCLSCGSSRQVGSQASLVPEICTKPCAVVLHVRLSLTFPRCQVATGCVGLRC